MPFGLLVRLEDGRTAIIRERELTWTAEQRRNWRQTYQPGIKVQAVMLDERGSDSPELSIRLAQFDPWLTLPERISPGQLVEGVVTVVQPFGAFIEIQPGVTGLLHRSALPAWCGWPIADVFWPGDAVKAVVQRVDVQERRIALVLEDIREVRWRDASRVNSKARAGAQTDASTLRPSRSLLPLGLASLTRAYSVLLVDDDAECRETWVRWLRNAGQHAVGAALAGDALQLLSGGEAFDLVLMDAHLPDMLGAEALARILDSAPEVRGVLISGDWGYLANPDPLLRRLQAAGVRFLPKPFQADELLSALLPPDAAGSGDVGDGHSDKGTPRELGDPAGEYVGPQRLLEQALLRAQRLTRAALAVLFRLDVASRKVEVELPHNDRRLNPEALLNLVHSPVRDVAEDHTLCIIENAAAAAARARYLLPLLAFGACMGIAVPADCPHRYALFFFYDRPTALDEARCEQARAGALAVGAALERREMIARIVECQRDILLGQLNRGLVHELNNRISAARNSMALLTRQLQCVQCLPTVAPTSTGQTPYASKSACEAIQLARESLDDALKNVESLAHINGLFRRFAAESNVGAVPVERLAREAVEMTRDLAERHGVTVEVEQYPSLLIVRANPVHLQHVLLNVITNAVQQIALLRPKKSGHEGHVRIRFEERQRRAGPVVIISVEDDGPGIHHHQLPRIFDLGFTTRKDGGSGLGLYVARHLVEGMHGRISVAESARLWGTRFVVELPVGV